MAMGNEIPEQLAMFLRSVALGGVLGLVYDLARCLRRLGGPLWRGLLDVAVSLTTAASLFFFIMAGSGELRLFILIGALGGGVLFFSLLSPLLRPLWDFWLDLLLIPARLLGRIGKKLYRICKKLFSFPRKWFTIIVTHWRERLRPARGGGEEMAAAKKSGKKAKKRSGGKLPLLIFLALLLAVGIQLYNMQGQLEAARAEEAVYAQRLAELRETNERLATDIANSDDPELIEEIARDELGMVEQGEKIIRFNY